MSNNIIYYDLNNENATNNQIFMKTKRKILDFDEIVSDISNYLFASENSDEIQYLYMLGRRCESQKQDNKQLFRESIAEYNEIIKSTALFIKGLGLKNNPTSYYTIFSYLLWNGFISKNMKYIFTNNDLLSLMGFQGLDIINGKGSCRTISNMLNSVFQQLDFDTHFLVNSVRTNFRDHITNIQRNNEHGVVPQTTTISYNQKIDQVGNHASILLKKDGNYYVYDPTNLSVYKVDETIVGNLYNGIGECHIKPWGFIFYENMNKSQIIDLLHSMSHQNKNTFMSNLQVRETIDETLNICNRSKSLALDFNNQIQGNINTIYTSLFHK